MDEIINEMDRKMDREEKLIAWMGVSMIVMGILFFVLMMSCAKADNLHLPMRYLIGADNPQGRDGYITVMPYDGKPSPKGVSAAYGNLLDEINSGRYGPYLAPSGTSKEYREGLIDPHGPGFMRNLNDQLDRRWREGFHIIELDNPDSYGTAFTLVAVTTASNRGFQVLAKNPLLLSSPAMYLAHPAVVGAIVERGAGDPARMNRLRITSGKPSLPIWFVSYGSGGLNWARAISSDARKHNMNVTHSARGEYTTSTEIVGVK